MIGIIRYQRDTEFRKQCEADERLTHAMNAWFGESHRRADTDETFTGRIILNKLRWFYLGKLGLSSPVELDDTELALLDRLYRTNLRFRLLCIEYGAHVFDAVAYCLEEFQRKGSSISSKS